MDTMVVNNFDNQSIWASLMAEGKSTTLSVRIPTVVAMWVNENGGSQLLRSLLYAYIYSCSHATADAARAKVLQSIIEEFAANSLQETSEAELDIQANIKLE